MSSRKTCILHKVCRCWHSHTVTTNIDNSLVCRNIYDKSGTRIYNELESGIFKHTIRMQHAIQWKNSHRNESVMLYLSFQRAHIVEYNNTISIIQKSTTAFRLWTSWEKKKIHRKNRECHSGNIIPSSFTLQTKAGVNDCSNWVYMDGKWAESQCSLCMCAHDNSRLFASFLFVYRACARRTRAYTLVHTRAYTLAHTRVCLCMCVYILVGIPSCVCSCERAFTEFVKSIYTRIIYLNTKRRFMSLQKFRITSNEFTMMMPRM